MIMKKLLLGLVAIATVSLVSCQPSKDELRKTFMESCEKSASGQGVSAEMAKSYCECSADKVLASFSNDELKKIGKNNLDAESTKKMMEVIQPCIEDMQKQMMGGAEPAVPAEEPAAAE